MKWWLWFLMVGWISTVYAQPQSVKNAQYDYIKHDQLENQHIRIKEYEVWGLTPQDWTRYQLLMKGHRGILSPNIDPIVALGVEAETEAERQRLAEIHVRFEKARNDKEWAFQHSVNQAWNKLYPNAQMIDMKKLEQAQTPMVEQLKGRLLFFTALNDCQSCEVVLSELMQQVEQGRQLDIFITGAKNDDQIRQWAKERVISPQLVRSRLITLNHEKGKLGLISSFTGKVPYVAVKTGSGRYQTIEMP